MNKLDMAHEYLRDIISNWEYDESFNPVAEAWKYADAMKAEADKREQKGFPEVLQPEVDWRLAPSWANYYKTDGKNSAWTSHDFDPVGDEVEQTYSIGFLWNDAPSFGFTGYHIVERPQ